jgi:hypothetical protein
LAFKELSSSLVADSSISARSGCPSPDNTVILPIPAALAAKGVPNMAIARIDAFSFKPVLFFGTAPPAREKEWFSK